MSALMREPNPQRDRVPAASLCRLPNLRKYGPFSDNRRAGECEIWPNKSPHPYSSDHVNLLI